MGLCPWRDPRPAGGIHCIFAESLTIKLVPHMRSLLLIPILMLLLGSCVQENPQEGPGHIVSRVYANPNPLRSVGADTSLLSENLSVLVARALEVEKLDRDRVLRSDHPTDKPLLLEGELFAGLYEGYTSFALGRVRESGDTLTAPMNFHNRHYGMVWTDTLILVRKNGWKLHDVRYGRGAGLQETLRDFINHFGQHGE
jgi:hypothetical protein